MQRVSVSKPPQVKVRCLATLERFQPEQPVQLEAGETPFALLMRLGLPREEVNLTLVNGERADWDAFLQAGDTVTFVPLVGGG